MSELSPDSSPSPHRTPIGSAYAKGLLGDALNAPLRYRPGTGWKPPSAEDLGRMLTDIEILEFIGRGGMGAVYKGRDVKLGRNLAIKLLPPELGSQTEFSERFMREARSLAKLEHPNIIHVYQLGTTPEEHLYFTMEYVEGTDLKHLLRSLKKESKDGKSGVLEFNRAMKIFRQICDALSYAHQESIIHRDIKPANILISKKGDAKVADFGLARPLDGLDLDRLTESHEVIGTQGYMAPELLGGMEGDHRVDVFAMGVLLYELLTGELPDSPNSIPSRKRPMDKRLDQVVIKARQTAPEQRFSSIAEMAKELDIIQKSALSQRTKILAFAGFVIVALGGATAAWKVNNSQPVTDVEFAPAAAELMYYQPFDLSPGEDALANHAKFKSTVTGKVDADSDIMPGSLTYADAAGNELVTAGNFALVDTDDETSQVSNVAPFTVPAEYKGNVLWISLIGQQTAGDGSRFFNLVLRGLDNINFPPDKNNIHDEILSIGVSSRKKSPNWQIWNRESSNLELCSMAYSKVPATQRAFLLARIELNYQGSANERYSLWVNPRLDQDPPEPDIYITPKHSDMTDWSDIREIRLAAGYQLDMDPSSGWALDEIRIGATRKSVTPYVAPRKQDN